MQRLLLCLVVLSCLIFETGCISRKMGFQPKVAPELSSSVKKRPPQQTGSLLAGDWQKTYHDTITNGECADGSKPNGANCPGGIAYTDYLKGIRNSYIEAIRGKIDENYSDFRSSVYSGNAVFGMASDWAVIGLGGAGTVVADAGLKSILAAASSGVAGASASYQKQVLNQQNTLAIVAGMDASRAAQYVVIVQSESSDVTKYSLENGISDLRKYYDAGTMLGGVLYIQGQMQKEAKSSTANSQGLKNGSTTIQQSVQQQLQ